jgi:triacylglycerol lipase
MSLRTRGASAVSPPQIEARLRALGAVLDLRTATELYSPLLALQPREGVLTTRDQAYGPDERHRLDVYAPAKADAARDVLMIFHGGGFIRGDKSERENLGLYFARAGFVTIVPNYRLAPAAQWPAGAEDVVAATLWAAAHVRGFGGDAARIWLLGESAGAAHVATASLLRRFHPPGGLQVQGLILISGVYNVHLERLARAQFGVPTPDPRSEAYFGADSARYPAMSIIDLVDAPPLPMLITYAEMDLLQMQVQAGELFARLVTRHGYAPELAVIRAHNHLSQIISINTGDESLTTPILGFLRARPGYPRAP